MKKHCGMLLFSLVVAFMAPVVLYAASMPSVGTLAPDFTLTSQEGTPVRLAQYRGKWVVLYFYPKDMTTGCTIEAHNFQRDQAKYQAKDTVVLGVSVDSANSHKTFCTKEGLTFKLLADTEHKVSDAYGSLTTYGSATLAARNTFLIDPHGKIVKVYTKVDPNKHSEEVLTALSEVQAAEKPEAAKE